MIKDENNCRDKNQWELFLESHIPNIIINIKINIKTLINIKMNIDGEDLVLYILYDHSLSKSQYKISAEQRNNVEKISTYFF